MNFNLKLLSDEKCLTLMATHQHTAVPQPRKEQRPQGCGHNEADPSCLFGTENSFKSQQSKSINQSQV